METGETSNEQMNQTHQVALDINKLIEESVTEEFAKLKSLSGECSIYRVPKRLRNLNKKAYTPQVVSIGPIHHGKEELRDMEDHKKRYLQDFLRWSEVSMNDFIDLIEKSKSKLLNCYAETIELIDKDFMKMILVDAALVIMVLVKYSSNEPPSSNDRIFRKPWLISYVRLDMCLIENQIPFFILKDFLELSNVIKNAELNLPTEISCAQDPIIVLTHSFFKAKWDSWLTEDSLETVKIKSCKIKHFTDFLRICQQPPKLEDRRKEVKKLNIPSVTELQQAGVTFNLGSSSKSLLDIKFNKDKGILEIPQLVIEDTTEILFRNLHAFEQCNYCETYVSDYICLIGFLVNASKDVKILIEHEIVDNWLQSAEAASLLCENLNKENSISSDDFHFAGLLEDLKTYCGRTWPNLKVNLKQNYFNNPWVSISVIAAALLFMLTVLQTVVSIIQIA